MDQQSHWLRRAGLALVVAYFAFALLAFVVGQTLLRHVSFHAPELIRAFLLTGALLYTGMLLGLALMVLGLVGTVASRRRGSPLRVSTKAEVWASAVLVAVGALSVYESGQSRTVQHRIGKPGIAKPYKVLYPERTSAEPGDVEARLLQSVRVGDLSVRVTRTRLIDSEGELDTWDHGWYLVVDYQATNHGTTPESFDDPSEWEFDVPGKGVTTVDPTGGPLSSNAFTRTVPAAGSIDGRVSLYLGATRAAIPSGRYFVLWSPAPCELSRANHLPLHDCRGVWPATPAAG